MPMGVGVDGASATVPASVAPPEPEFATRVRLPDRRILPAWSLTIGKKKEQTTNIVLGISQPFS